MSKNDNQTNSTSRRAFIKKLAYMPPAIASLTVLPAFHASGSGWGANGGSRGNNGIGNGVDPQPPGNPPVNDGFGNLVGNPGNRRGSNR